MKTFILAWTAISIMAAAPVANAGKCRYEKNEIDSSTNVRTLATEWNVISRTLDVFITTRVVRVSADTVHSDGGTDKVRYEVKSRATIHYPLDADTFLALTSQGATRVRLSTKDKHFEFDVDKKSVNDFQQALYCLKAEAS